MNWNVRLMLGGALRRGTERQTVQQGHSSARVLVRSSRGRRLSWDDTLRAQGQPGSRLRRPGAQLQPQGRVLVQDTTCHMSISLDGFVAGPEQSREDPLGKRGMELHAWHLGDERANEADETAASWLMRARG